MRQAQTTAQNNRWNKGISLARRPNFPVQSGGCLKRVRQRLLVLGSGVFPDGARQLWLAKLLDEAQSPKHEPARFQAEDRRADAHGSVGDYLRAGCSGGSAFTGVFISPGKG
jgi:hypothetical protein